MNSVSYNNIINWLSSKAEPITIPTLGRRKTLTFWVENGKVCGHDSNGNRNDYPREYWDEICDVIDRTEPERREITTNYAHCRSFRKAPGVPALCRAYCEEHLVN